MSCHVSGCARKAQVREVYQGPEEHIPVEVCNAHTGVHIHRFPMVGKEPLPGEVVYQIGEQ